MISVLLASAFFSQEVPQPHWSDGVKVVVLISADQKLEVNYRSLKALRTLQEEREWEVYKPEEDVAYILDTDSTGIAMSKGLSDMADEIEATGALGAKSAAFILNIGERIHTPERHAKMREQGMGSIGFGNQVFFESGATTVLTSPIEKVSAPVKFSEAAQTRKFDIGVWMGFLSTRVWGNDRKMKAEFSTRASAWATGKIAAATEQNVLSIQKLCWLFNYQGYKHLESQKKELKTAKDLIPLFPVDSQLQMFGDETIRLITPAIEIRITVPGESGISFYLIS
ncbi:MAG: hypothetical protein KF836_12505 [Fimbriimonadaceae bacterium]|nr:hypothetical protein [Fimbriimonadaceae bacterium]